MERRRFLLGAALSPLAGAACGRSSTTGTPSGDLNKVRRAAELGKFPYPVIVVPGSKALENWERLRSSAGTPVVLGGDDDLTRVAESISIAAEDGDSAHAILEKAAQFEFPADFRARLQREAAAIQDELRADPNMSATEKSQASAEISLEMEPMRGPWPKSAPQDPGLSVAQEIFISGSNARQRPFKKVYIATLPTQDWTEAFAYLAFGGWNECPYPHEHVAAFRYWTSRYDLALAGMSGDVLNLRAGRPPKTRDEALALAREQYEFCPDIVDQGVTLDELAAGLLNKNWWFFWWD